MKSLTTALSRRTSTRAGKATSAGIVHVRRDVFVGFTKQLEGRSAIWSSRVLTDRSGTGSIIRKLISLPAISHIVTSPLRRGGCCGATMPEVGEGKAGSVAGTAVADTSSVAASVGRSVGTSSVGGGWVAVGRAGPWQNCPFTSTCEAVYNCDDSENSPST